MEIIKNGELPAGSYYRNFLTEGAADPFVLYENGVYYMYSTGVPVTVRTSKDLVNWSPRTAVLDLNDFNWAVNKSWAPEVYRYNGKYYMVFSACDKLHSIGVAVSDGPCGMFRPLMEEPLHSPGFSVIDASLLFDDDGRIYLFYSKDCSTNYVNGIRTSQIYGAEVSADLKTLISEPVFISTPEQLWEHSPKDTVLWNEGPVVRKHDGRYYLFYSANYYMGENYSVGYAYSDRPLARYTKPDECCILKKNGSTVTGPGHCNLFYSPDGTELYMCYHVHTVPPKADKGRSLCIDRVYFRDDGSVYVDGPSTVIMHSPSGTAGYRCPAGGYTVSVEGKTHGDSGCLSDGVIVNCGTEELRTEGAAVINIDLSCCENAIAVLVYPGNDVKTAPASCSAEINGRYVIADVEFPDDGNPAAIVLTGLPKDTDVRKIRITVTPRECGECSLGEIVVIEKDGRA